MVHSVSTKFILLGFKSVLGTLYVLIPVPTAKSRPAPSSLTTSLERSKAWYGLSDLSYGAVKARFGLKD